MFTLQALLLLTVASAIPTHTNNETPHDANLQLDPKLNQNSPIDISYTLNNISEQLQHSHSSIKIVSTSTVPASEPETTLDAEAMGALMTGVLPVEAVSSLIITSTINKSSTLSTISTYYKSHRTLKPTQLPAKPANSRQDVHQCDCGGKLIGRNFNHCDCRKKLKEVLNVVTVTFTISGPVSTQKPVTTCSHKSKGCGITVTEMVTETVTQTKYYNPGNTPSHEQSHHVNQTWTFKHPPGYGPPPDIPEKSADGSALYVPDANAYQHISSDVSKLDDSVLNEDGTGNMAHHTNPPYLPPVWGLHYPTPQNGNHTGMIFEDHDDHHHPQLAPWPVPPLSPTRAHPPPPSCPFHPYPRFHAGFVLTCNEDPAGEIYSSFAAPSFSVCLSACAAANVDRHNPHCAVAAFYAANQEQGYQSPGSCELQMVHFGPARYVPGLWTARVMMQQQQQQDGHVQQYAAPQGHLQLYAGPQGYNGPPSSLPPQHYPANYHSPPACPSADGHRGYTGSGIPFIVHCHREPLLPSVPLRAAEACAEACSRAGYSMCRGIARIGRSGRCIFGFDSHQVSRRSREPIIVRIGDYGYEGRARSYIHGIGRFDRGVEGRPWW
jgi:hypothetical protein